MAEKRDPSIVALEAVYAALKELDATGRKKVLSSAFALLGVEGTPIPSVATQVPNALPVAMAPAAAGRPVGLVELINEKKPGTNAQCIAIFAYYREKVEGLPRFGRDDLRPYFAKAKHSPASNFDRDFRDAVSKGWIHEDGSESYLTTKGIEAIEAGFEGERKYSKGRQSNSKKKPRRSTKQKKR